MTEIPEHLLKRAKEAREKAAAEEAPAAAAETPADAAAGAGEEAASDPRIPAHLLERSRAARSKTADDAGESEGGGAVAVADKVGAVVTAAPGGGSVPLGAGPGGHTQRLLTVVKSGSIQEVKAAPDRQGAHMAPPARRRVRRLPVVHRVHVPVLGVGQRPAAATRQPEPDTEPVEGAVVLPRSPGTAHDVPPDDRRRDDPRRRADRAHLRSRTSTRTRPTSPRTASSRSR